MSKSAKSKAKAKAKKKAKNVKRGKRSRNKGAEFERAVAIALRGIWPNAKRGVGQSQTGNNGADVEGTPFWVECKTGKFFTLKGAIAQGEKETDGRPVIVVSRRPHMTPLVTMRMILLAYVIQKPGASTIQLKATASMTLVSIPLENFVGFFDGMDMQPTTGRGGNVEYVEPELSRGVRKEYVPNEICQGVELEVDGLGRGYVETKMDSDMGRGEENMKMDSDMVPPEEKTKMDSDMGTPERNV